MKHTSEIVCDFMAFITLLAINEESSSFTFTFSTKFLHTERFRYYK